MAKSLRSKWRRKCRAVKRERYSKKELERLKKTLGIDNGQDNKDVNMTEVQEIATVKTARELRQRKQKPEEENSMETDQKKRVFNPKTLRDQHGAHPVWLHPRKYIRKTKTEKRKEKGKRKTKKN